MAHIQRNIYKGSRPRCWLRLCFAASDGSLHERELLADTGSLCAVILGTADVALFFRSAAPGVNTNFGQLSGAWLELAMPELNLTTRLRGFGSDHVLQAVQTDSSDFAGLIGLPLLRMLEYGGDASAFWVRSRAMNP